MTTAPRCDAAHNIRG
jgi:hypothetical protein